MIKVGQLLNLIDKKADVRVLHAYVGKDGLVKTHWYRHHNDENTIPYPVLSLEVQHFDGNDDAVFIRTITEGYYND